MGKIKTENRVFPVCPWCGAELDPEEFAIDEKEQDIEDGHWSIEVLCPECNEAIEIITRLTYSTYKSDKEIDELVDDDFYNDGYSYEEDEE